MPVRVNAAATRLAVWLAIPADDREAFAFVPFPRLRLSVVDSMHVARRKPLIHALIESTAPSPAVASAPTRRGRAVACRSPTS
jgi:hypothetical protein